MYMNLPKHGLKIVEDKTIPDHGIYMVVGKEVWKIINCGVEAKDAHRSHKPGQVGSSPTSAKKIEEREDGC